MRWFILLVFLNVYNSYAQELKGTIIDSKSSEPIVSATVYLDGTSIGTISDFKGGFSLEKPEELTADLIISIIGYEKLRISTPEKADLSIIKLTEKTNVLEEVVLELDPWSRATKERFFKEQFLGSVPAAKKCEILNLDKIRLRFNPSTKLLTAIADEPIVIINNHLGYQILYDLKDFEIEYQQIDFKSTAFKTTDQLKATNYILKRTFYLGSSFFKELENEKPKMRKRQRRRKKAYELSDLRFLRALKNQTLKEEGYRLFYKGNLVDIKNHLRVKQYPKVSHINFRYDRYELLINDKYQSFIKIDDQVLINKFGINVNPRSLQIGGYIAKIKISGLLPLDYGL